MNVKTADGFAFTILTMFRPSFKLIVPLGIVDDPKRPNKNYSNVKQID